ncbi:hypothetical protein [Microbacterium sp. JB110]|uniref:hypothetical protein n=1 Tax=Microbacterium sp. JB110 TaxID=2024477 RepID=UPI00097F52B4|nr:hypothetical protein [Microbacterium sp. JB110]RCS60341.1 hypothetical protein CIK77_10055 [Microbacterium sp. JB110]SJM48855.1 COG2719: Uncharacterized conserved protein [Frigoribacterium sp. JB110]
MSSEGRRRRAARKVKPGDGHALQRYRWWQLFSRSLFHLRLRGIGGAPETWTIDVRLGGDSDGEVWAKLYRDGVNQARSKLPAAFDVPGGTIEVHASSFGLKRCHYVTYDGAERQLAPDPASAEGLRARLDRDRPVLSRSIGTVSVVLLVVALVLGVPQLVEQVTHIPPVADAIGTFVSPIQLPAWMNISLLVVTLLASTERALRLRYNWILDGGIFDGDVG